MELPSNVKRIFLTGGAGFIGSHVLDLFADSDCTFVVYDNLSNGKLEYISDHLDKDNVIFVEGDILNGEVVQEAMKGCDLVWHLAANRDIIGRHHLPSRDLHDGAVGTFQVLEAMRKLEIRDLLFASSGAVYGNICAEQSVTEDAGPLLPVSTYGAAKIACEAFISSFCHVYGLRSWMYRFGNVIGARMTHGVIFDFIHRLKEDSSHLLVRGDGRQEKNYFLVEECIHGMLHGYENVPLDEDNPVTVLNLGTPTITRVVDIADIIISEMELSNTPVKIEGTRKAWPGDQPRVHFEVDAIESFGWKTVLNSDQSVKIAVQRMLDKAESQRWVR